MSFDRMTAAQYDGNDARALQRRRDVSLFTLLAIAIFIAIALVRTSFWTYGADTGTFAQVVVDALHGMRNGIEHGTHYRYHWSPSLILLWPLMALTRSALTLQILQVILTFATAPLVFELFRPYAGSRIAARLAYLALLYPPLEAIGFNEFHELGMLTPVIIGAVLAADRSRWVVFALLVMVAAGLREDVCLELVIIGTALAISLRTRRPTTARAAALTALVSAASIALYYGAVIPHLGAWRPAVFYRYSFADGPLQVVTALLIRPVTTVPVFLTLGRLTYILEALVPLAFLPLRSAWTFLAVPGFCVILLANSGLVWRMGMHYSALWIPWLLLATGFAVVGIARRTSERIALRRLTIAMTVCGVFLIAFNPMHPLHYLRPSYHDIAAARATLACVPPSASVSTHDEWFSAIAAGRPRATVGVSGDVDYLVYADDYPNDEFRAILAIAVKHAVARGAYRTICAHHHVSAYVRTAR